MIKETLQSINGVELFPIVALVIFFIVFAGVLMWVYKIDKKTIKEMESIPFDNFHYDGDK